MSKEPKKTAQATGPVVYCGPTIPGVAVQYAVYTNGIPAALAAHIEKKPAFSGLVVSLDELPDAMKKLRGGYGHIYQLYRKAQANS